MSDYSEILQRLDAVRCSLDSLKLQRMSPWLTGVSQIAKYLSWGRSKTSKAIKAGKLKVHRQGGTVMVRRLDIDSAIMFGRTFSRLTKQQKSIIREGYS